MTFTPRSKRNTTRLVSVLIAAGIVFAALIFFFYPVSHAQSVNPPTATVDPIKPAAVKVQILDKDKKPDPTTAALVKFAVSGSNEVGATGDAEANVTFTPTPNLAGKQSFQLLNKDRAAINGDGGKPLTVEVDYPAPAAVSAPTPDISWIERFNAEVRRNNIANWTEYRWLVIIVFSLSLGAFVFTMVKGILRSKSTFRTPTGLPVGTFRAILAYTLVLLLGFYVLTSLLVVALVPPPDFLLGIVATVVGFYFGSRTGDEGSLDARSK